jgi:hypothetical protein
MFHENLLSVPSEQRLYASFAPCPIKQRNFSATHFPKHFAANQKGKYLRNKLGLSRQEAVRTVRKALVRRANAQSKQLKNRQRKSQDELRQ